jgi:hypothetical protein
MTAVLGLIQWWLNHSLNWVDGSIIWMIPCCLALLYVVLGIAYSWVSKWANLNMALYFLVSFVFKLVVVTLIIIGISDRHNPEHRSAIFITVVNYAIYLLFDVLWKKKKLSKENGE